MKLSDGVKAAARSFQQFTERCAGMRLRPYQVEAGQAVLDSIRLRRGDSIVVMMSRQAGKDELCANLKAYLLSRFMNREAGIVEVNPTYKPQTINAIDRLERRLETNLITRLHWRKRSDFMRLVGKARVSFLSGDAHASVVGATADLLLIVNEAQDIDAAVYDKRFAPMAASSNATRVFMGTAWTSQTLLAREMRAAQQAEQRDGRRRVFRYDAQDVRKDVPAYGDFVDGEIARLGRGHPLVRTQFFNEEIDAQAGMFNAARRALMRADRAGASSPQPGAGYEIAFLIDVGGMQEGRPALADPDGLSSSRRDSTTLSVVEIDPSTLEVLQAPTYRVLDRRLWTGCNHLTVFGQLKALAESWRPRHIVVDATGVGEGLWAMLDKAFPTRVIPVKFSSSTKSEIGYRFLAIIETGRFKDCSSDSPAIPDALPTLGGACGSVPSRADVDRQYSACQAEILIGPRKTMRWGVPEGRRDADGRLIHDDIPVTDSLTAVLDRLQWSASSPTFIIRPKDPLDDMSHFRP